MLNIRHALVSDLNSMNEETKAGLIAEGMVLVEELLTSGGNERSESCLKVNRHLSGLSEENVKFLQFVKYVLELDKMRLRVLTEKIYGVQVSQKNASSLAKEWLFSSSSCLTIAGDLTETRNSLNSWLQDFERRVPEKERDNKVRKVFWLCMFRLEQHVRLLKTKEPHCWRNVDKLFPGHNVATSQEGDTRNDDARVNKRSPVVFSETQMLHLFGYTSNGSINRKIKKRDPSFCTAEEMYAVIRGLDHVAGNRIKERKNKVMKFSPADIVECLKHARSEFDGGTLPSEAFDVRSEFDNSDKFAAAFERAKKSKMTSRMNTGSLKPRDEEIYLGAYEGNLTVAAGTYAIARFKKKMEETCLSFEHVLPHSHRLWKQLDLLDENGKMILEVNIPFFMDVCLFAGADDIPPLKNLDGQALSPFVLGSPGLTRKTMDALMKHLDHQLFVAVEHGGGFQRAAFANNGMKSHCPSTSVGKNKVITSTSATVVERALMELQTFMLALLGNAINEHLCARLNLDVPTPDIGLTPSAFFESLECFEIVENIVIVSDEERFKRIYGTAPEFGCCESMVDSYLDSLHLGKFDDKGGPARKKHKPNNNFADECAGPKYLNKPLWIVMKENCDEYRVFRNNAVMTNIVNMLLCNVPKGQSVGFSRHQDVSEDRGQDMTSTCFEPSYQCDRTCPLPTPDVLMISTDILMPCCSKADAEVTWTNGESSDPVRVASVVTGNTTKVLHHIQGPCTNAQMNYHQVDSCGNVAVFSDRSNPEVNLRASLTYRSVLVPEYNWPHYVKKQVENGFTEDSYGCGKAKSGIHRCLYSETGVFSGSKKFNITSMRARAYWEEGAMEEKEKTIAMKQLQCNDSCSPSHENVVVDSKKKQSDYECMQFLRPSREQFSLFQQKVMPVFVDGSSGMPVVSKSGYSGFKNQERPPLKELMMKAIERLKLGEESLPWDVQKQNSEDDLDKHCNWSTCDSAQSDAERQLVKQCIGHLKDGHGVRGFRRPLKFIALQGKVSDVCYNAQFIEVCLKNGHMPVVLDKSGRRIVDQPVHSSNNFIMQSNTEMEHHESPIDGNKFSKVVVDPLRPSLLRQTKLYKNLMGNTEAQKRTRSEMFSRADTLMSENPSMSSEDICCVLKHEGQMSEFEDENPIVYYLSGATSSLAGENSPILSSMSIDEIHYKVAERQDPTSLTNRALLTAVQRESPVGVLHADMTTEKPLGFAGHFVPFEIHGKKQSLSEIVAGVKCSRFPSPEDQLRGFDIEKRMHAFKCELPVSVSAKPAFSFETELAIKESLDKQTPFQSLFISLEDKRNLCVEVDAARRCMLEIMLKSHLREKEKQRTGLEVLAEKCEKDINELSASDIDVGDLCLAGMMDRSVDVDNQDKFVSLARHACLSMLRTKHDKAKSASRTRLETIAFNLGKALEEVVHDDVRGHLVPDCFLQKHKMFVNENLMHLCNEDVESLQKKALVWLKNDHEVQSLEKKTDLEVLACLAKKNDISLLTWRDIPIHLVTKQAVIEEAGRNFENFKTNVELNPNCFVKSPLMKMRIPIADFVPNIVCVAAAQALRMSRQGCLIKAKDMPFHRGPITRNGKDLLCHVPLFAHHSPWLPDVLRRRSFPGVRPNDVAVLVACGSMKEVFNLWKEWERIKPDANLQSWCKEILQGSTSVSTTETRMLNSRMVLDHLWVATVQRMLGDPVFVKSHGDWKRDVKFFEEGHKLNCCLPRFPSIKQFIRYLAFKCGGYFQSVSPAQSKQHDRSVHRSVTASVAKFAQYLMNLAPAYNVDNGCGVPSSQNGVVAFVVKKWMTQNQKERKRSELVDSISKALSNAGHLQGFIGCRFLAGQVVADFESFAPGFAGEVTVDSVPLGYGAKQGLDALEFQGACHNVNRHRPKNRLSRFCYLHKHVVGELKAQGKIRDVLGLILIGGKLLWEHNNLEYSFVDTEHFCCKIAVMLLACTASRTLAENQSVGSNYTHPVSVTLPDEVDVIARGMRCWNAFATLNEADRCYSYQLDSYKGSHVSVHSILSSIRAHCVGEPGRRNVSSLEVHNRISPNRSYWNCVTAKEEC